MKKHFLPYFYRKKGIQEASNQFMSRLIMSHLFSFLREKPLEAGQT